MGILGIKEAIVKVAGDIADITKEAVLDKDKLLDLKMKMVELGYQAEASAREHAMSEIQDPNKFRALQRPIWSMVCASGFALQMLSIVANWVSGMARGIPEIPALVFPLPVNAVILSVVAFYFGGRMLEKNNTTNKFFDKWGV